MLRSGLNCSVQEPGMNAIPDRPVPASDTGETRLPARRSWRRILGVPLALLALIMAMIAGTWWLTEGRWIESTDNAYVQGDITVLSPRIDGDISAVLVSDNQRVHAGDPLVELDPADWKARALQAEAAVAEARASIATLQAQIAQQRTNLT